MLKNVTVETHMTDTARWITATRNAKVMTARSVAETGQILCTEQVS